MSSHPRRWQRRRKAPCHNVQTQQRRRRQGEAENICYRNFELQRTGGPNRVDSVGPGRQRQSAVMGWAD